MRILVTGANGYMGRYVVRELLDRGHEVYVSDIRYDEVDARAIRADAEIFGGADDLYERLGSPEVCLHLAWRNGFVHNDLSHIDDFPKHYHFIKSMIEGGVRKIASMGTMHEVGYHEGPVDEFTPCNPRSNYAVAKNALRQLTLMLAEDKGVLCQWIRGYYIIGDDLKNNSIFSKLTAAAQEGKKEFPFTSGKNKYDFISVQELAKQIAAVVSQDEVTGIINCCSGVAVSLADKVEGFIREKGYDITLKYGAFPDRPYDSPAIWGDAGKIRQILKDDKYLQSI